jgi:uncharacterized protein (TIGR02996 family)
MIAPSLPAGEAFLDSEGETMSDLRAALEAHLAENPDDPATHRAYADFLHEQDDPRGEFIATQLALEDETLSTADRAHLRLREADLLQAHQTAWLGPLAPLIDEKDISDWRRRKNKINRVGWARGWLDDLYLFRLNLDGARILARCPATRLLRRLHIEQTGYESGYEPQPDDHIPPGSEYPSLYPLTQAPFLPNLRFFQLGETVEFTRENYNCRTNAEGVVDLVRGMARVEELHLLAHDIDTAALFALPNLTHLRVLLVYHTDHYDLKALADNPALGRLTTLRLHPGHSYADSPSLLPRDQVRLLLHSPHLKSLTHLHLHASDLGDEGVRDIIDSGILKRLKVLDLRHGCIQDHGARLLAACPDVRNLELLDLTWNALEQETADALEEEGSSIVSGDQYDEPEAYHYSGDME